MFILFVSSVSFQALGADVNLEPISKLEPRWLFQPGREARSAESPAGVSISTILISHGLTRKRAIEATLKQTTSFFVKSQKCPYLMRIIVSVVTDREGESHGNLQMRFAWTIVNASTGGRNRSVCLSTIEPPRVKMHVPGLCQDHVYSRIEIRPDGKKIVFAGPLRFPQIIGLGHMRDRSFRSKEPRWKQQIHSSNMTEASRAVHITVQHDGLDLLVARQKIGGLIFEQGAMPVKALPIGWPSPGNRNSVTSHLSIPPAEKCEHSTNEGSHAFRPRGEKSSALITEKEVSGVCHRANMPHGPWFSLLGAINEHVVDETRCESNLRHSHSAGAVLSAILQPRPFSNSYGRDSNGAGIHS